MRTVAIIQARVDSERLPGKVLEKIGDATVLGWVVYRTRQIKLDQIVVATTGLKSDDAIVSECGYLDVECFRGSADDVLDRYYQAANHYAATHILRVTGDCPLLDPWLNQRILAELLGNTELDYTAAEGWPGGVGQEAFTMAALDEAWMEADNPGDREHVVPYMIRVLKCGFVFQKFSIDTQDDLDHLRGLHDKGMFDVPAG